MLLLKIFFFLKLRAKRDRKNYEQKFEKILKKLLTKYKIKYKISTTKANNNLQNKHFTRSDMK